MALLPSGSLIHLEGECGPLTNFTEVSYQTFLDCREIWLTLEGVQRNIAEKKQCMFQQIVTRLDV